MKVIIFFNQIKRKRPNTRVQLMYRKMISKIIMITKAINQLALSLQEKDNLLSKEKIMLILINLQMED